MPSRYLACCRIACHRAESRSALLIVRKIETYISDGYACRYEPHTVAVDDIAALLEMLLYADTGGVPAIKVTVTRDRTQA